MSDISTDLTPPALAAAIKVNLFGWYRYLYSWRQVWRESMS
jgi:hypothetical protein